MGCKGVYVNMGEFDDPSGVFYAKNQSYHLGGATVDLERRDYEKKSDYQKYGNHFVRIKMVSNNSLDDIVEMTLAKFPSFREVDFDKI